jgi:NADH:ubiquinone oxidoreductase subunit E
MLEMLNVSICVGSACHMKGSKEVIARLKELVAEHGLQGKVLLNGSFCTGNCEYAVCVVIDDTVFSVRPETTEEFFNNEILTRVS